MKPYTQTFEVNVNNNPVEVKATAFEIATGEKRFRVSYDGSPVHIFGWDENQSKVVAIDSASETIPAPIEHAIGRELQYKIAA